MWPTLSIKHHYSAYFYFVFPHEDLNICDIADCPYFPIFFIDILTDGILKLMTVNANKATECNQIPALILKSRTSVPVPILQSSFNQSLISSIPPVDRVFTNITSLFKTANCTEPAVYCFISLTSIIYKIFDHIMHKHIARHIDASGILSFRPKWSCETINHSPVWLTDN